MEFKCKDCIHYCICKDMWADENWTDEAPAEIRKMFSPQGCENFTAAPDNKTCTHCQPPYEHFGKYYIMTDYPNDPGLYILRRDDAMGGVMIDFCPMCGRKLDQ